MGGGRSASSGDYRYGFNGKEKDENGEWGNQTHYDYGFRIYNPSIAKFLSVDPLSSKFPWWSPYQFAANMPIWGIDLDGKEIVVKNISDDGIETIIATINYNTLVQQSPGLDNYDNNVINIINKDRIIFKQNASEQAEIVKQNVVEAAKRQIQRRRAERDLALHKARMSNPGYVAYELSDISDYITAADYVLKGEAKQAAFVVGLSLMPEFLERIGKVVMKGGAKTYSYPDGTMEYRYVDRSGKEIKITDKRAKRPIYENPGHHSTKPGDDGAINFRGGGSEKTVLLPDDAEALFQSAVPDINGPLTKTGQAKNWYAKDSDGNIHRYQTNHNGKTHWSGSTNGDSGLDNIPAKVKKKLDNN